MFGSGGRLAGLRVLSAVFMMFIFLGLITVPCFASYSDVEGWGIAVVGFRGKVLGSFVDGDFLYICGYVERYVDDKYSPEIFVAKINIEERMLVWYRVVENVRGWANLVLVKDGYVYVAGLLAGKGFIICLNSDGEFLWGYVTEKCFKGLLDLGDYVLAYGEGQFIILNREGDIVENVMIVLRNSVGEWSPLNVMKAIYVNGKIYALGYKWNLISEKRYFDLDGFLICFNKDLEVEWAVGFGTKEFNEYFTDIYYHNEYFYITGFSHEMGEEVTEEKGVIVAKFSLNGTPSWVKLFNSRCESAQSIHIFNEDIYVVGRYRSNISSLHDILVLKIGEEGEASAWTIGSSLEEFCWKSTPYREGIIVYGKSAIWSFNKTVSHLVIIYWPLDSVGEIKWGIENLESIRVEKKPIPIPSTPYEITFRSLELREYEAYCKKYDFKIVEKEITLNFAYGQLSSEEETVRTTKTTPTSPTIPTTPITPTTSTTITTPTTPTTPATPTMPTTPTTLMTPTTTSSTMPIGPTTPKISPITMVVLAITIPAIIICYFIAKRTMLRR